ncbi:MAG: DNA repair protein RecN [Thermomicrobiales bacterium]|nr:DNA repair protein RecN [Thermomicrobiales bacterium]
MLEQLVIRNFAIIDDLTVTFGPGFNVLTGETGAGKSILIDALGMVLGGRADADAVRSGAQRATIDAEFHLGEATIARLAPILDEQGIDGSDILLLTREIQAGGRSSARINGRPVTVGTLGQAGEALVDIHGQSDHLSLLKPKKQREILDAYGVERRLIDETASAVREWKSTLARLDDIHRTSRETAQRADLLTFQLGEIDSVSLTAGEDDALDREFARLSQVDRLVADVNQTLTLLDAEDGAAGEQQGALPSLRAADRSLTAVAAIDASAEQMATQLREAQFALDDVVLALRRYLDTLEADPARLEIVADRIARIRDLKRKYGATIADILDFRQTVANELESITGAGFDEESLRARANEQESLVRELIAKLHEARCGAASRLTGDVQGVISDLQLGSASFGIDVLPRTDLRSPLDPAAIDESGADDIEFSFAPNAGEQPKPLARIASGGEMARVMLALKTTLASADSIPTYVFDEVDVGVGGRSGFTVGEKLSALALERQIVVISHLPQVAGFADQHFRIRKVLEEGRTHSTIEQIDGAERIDELAAMFDGEPPSAASRANAVEMLERIQAFRGP